jgi:hypothetical protein
LTWKKKELALLTAGGREEFNWSPLPEIWNETKVHVKIPNYF